jgi:hypothetical protein
MNDDIYKIIIDINKCVGRIEGKLEGLEETDKICRNAADQAEEALCRVRELLDSLKWIFRAVMGALITSGIGALFYFWGVRI